MTGPNFLRNHDGHDPWWDQLGDAAQAARRKARLRARLAFIAAIAANLGALLGWVIRIGGGRA